MPNCEKCGEVNDIFHWSDLCTPCRAKKGLSKSQPCEDKNPVKMDYTREELIEICEKAIVHESEWANRDSASSVIAVGKCWALLKAGCKFVINDTNEPHTSTSDHTIWLRVYFDGFAVFEGTLPDGQKCEELFYLPAPGRLQGLDGKDWY